ncbi:hypothetical protein [Leptospira harrisiae]|uniref:hypothetical protein n=1 Tax=Leptospira harrisiae TaxID=2023189 RepID=UPI000C2AEB43|nr:hypothetical protein [Leptospira harrisiae]PKA06431.1 hypothetical protein CH366_19210 [Leptospira harrisiae]
MEKEKFNLRKELTSEQRLSDLDFTIDPGFLHRRKIETIMPPKLVKFIHEELKNLPDRHLDVQEDYVYRNFFLLFLNQIKAPTLRMALANKMGNLICAVEEFEPCMNIYEEERVISKWRKPEEFDIDVELHYSSNKVTSSTSKMELHKGDIIAFAAEVKKLKHNTLILEPIIMGAPWIRPSGNSVEPNFSYAWFGHDFYEIFIEDIDQFSKVKEVPMPTDFSIMKDISESAFKTCLAKILNDETGKDWGGETSDHFTTHLTLGGKRSSAAFLLKGPARFSPMNLNHLGKNNDQIVRLASESASVLFVQHSHYIQPAVRATLRAFAVQPGNPRKYCLIDGKDSLRILIAYNLLDEAINISKK